VITAPVQPEPLVDEEALFREARRLRRRRWSRGTLAVGVLAGAVATIVAFALSSGGGITPGTDAGTAGVLPNGSLASLKLAGALAVAPDGALYVADVGSDRILVRLADGRFRVVAGDGRVGFSGDGGPALRAELTNVSDLVVAANGTLYIADAGRVRSISRDGVIRTIVGNGKELNGTPDIPSTELRLIANGTPALQAPLGSSARPSWKIISAIANPLYIALDPRNGQLYVSTEDQILRLTPNGRLDTVRAIVPSGIGKGPLQGFGSIAIDTHGNIDVGGGPRGWSAWQVAPDGTATYLGFARMMGGDYVVVQPGPDNAIYTGSGGGSIQRIQDHRLVPLRASSQGILNGEAFPMTNFAFAPNGTIYTDDLPGNQGFERHQQLRAVRDSHVTLLWQEHNNAPR
jgi:hypothetical protein